ERPLTTWSIVWNHRFRKTLTHARSHTSTVMTRSPTISLRSLGGQFAPGEQSRSTTDRRKLIAIRFHTDSTRCASFIGIVIITWSDKTWLPRGTITTDSC